MKAWMLKLAVGVNIAVTKGRAQLQTWHKAGVTPQKEELAIYLQMVMADYQPQVNGCAILAHDDREHLTLALAGILISVMDAEASKEIGS